MMRRPGDAALCGRWYAADVAQSPTVAVLQLKWRGYPPPPPPGPRPPWEPDARAFSVISESLEDSRCE